MQTQYRVNCLTEWNSKPPFRNCKTVPLNVLLYVWSVFLAFLMTKPLDFVSFCESKRSYTILFIYSSINNINLRARQKSNGMNWECFTIGSSRIFYREIVYTQPFSNGSENFKLVEIYVPFLACQLFVFIRFTRIHITRTPSLTIYATFILLFPIRCVLALYPRPHEWMCVCVCLLSMFTTKIYQRK